MIKKSKAQILPIFDMLICTSRCRVDTILNDFYIIINGSFYQISKENSYTYFCFIYENRV